jgi:hypothetical protein
MPPLMSRAVTASRIAVFYSFFYSSQLTTTLFKIDSTGPLLLQALFFFAADASAADKTIYQQLKS